MAASEGMAVAGVDDGAASATLRFDTGMTFVMFLVVLLIAIIQVGFVVKGNSPVMDGALIDPDGYMRLARVEHLWQSGAWFDPVFPRIGPPEGLAMHWTRPFDLVLLAGALVASPVLGFKAALYWWGAFFGPLLQVGAVFALVWAAAPVLRRAWLALMPFMFLAQPAIFGSFAIGRPDHHGLQILLLILLIGFTLRVIFDPTRLRPAIAAGLVSALALWISVESILPIALSIGGIGLLWLTGDARGLRPAIVYAASLCGGIFTALLIERGAASIGEFEPDRISLMHGTIFLLNLAFWLSLGWLQKQGRIGQGLTSRMTATVLGAISAIAALWLLQPGLFANPMANHDALYMEKHLAHIEELQPALDFSKFADGSWYGAAAWPILWLGLAIPAVPWLVLRLRATAGAERLAWAFIGLAVILFLPLAARQLRWSFYPEVFLLIPYAALAGSILDSLSRGFSVQAVSVLRPLLMITLCLWFYVPTATSGDAKRQNATIKNATSCPLRDLTPVLNDPDRLGRRSMTIFALIDFGPEILYRTQHSVLSIPNHRYQPGFAAGYRIMAASDFGEAERGLRTANVDLILICPASAERWFYDTEGPAQTLNEALREGQVPPFLRQIDLPAEVSEQFKLYAVRPAQG